MGCCLLVGDVNLRVAMLLTRMVILGGSGGFRGDFHGAGDFMVVVVVMVFRW